jgi:hypothetical protein
MQNGAVIEVASLRNMQSNTPWEGLESYRLALRQAALVASSFLAAGRNPVVIIDTLAPRAFTYLRQHLKNPYRTITLTATRKTLLSRVRGRRHGFKDEKSILRLHQEIREENLPDVITLDTTNMNANEATDEIIRLVGLTDSNQIRRRRTNHK